MAGKRANGEGSIYQRAGRRGWFAAVTVDGRRKVLHADTRREVAELMTTALEARKTGGLVVGRAPTVATFLDQWAEEHIRPSRSAWTYRGYRSAIDTHIIPALGRVRLDRLTPQQVQGLMAGMSAGGASPKTVANVRAVLRSALTTARKWRLVSSNAAQDAEAPRGERHEIRPFDGAESKAFLAAIAGDRLEALYRVALSLGLRQGEALGLQWADVDLEAATLTVRRQLQRVDGDLTLVPLKTARSRRTLAMPAALGQAIREHRSRMLAEGRAAAGFVFVGQDGRPLEARTVLRWFDAILVRSSLRRIRFHDLRHSCASLLLAQGVAARVVMEVLGHAALSTTTDTYQHVVPELQREAAARMDAALS